MNVFERRSDLVAMSAVSDLVNGWPGGIIQAGRQGVFVTPIYLVNRLYASRLGVERLKTTRRLAGRCGRESIEGRRQIFLKAVNTDLEHPLTVRIRVNGAELSSTAEIERVTADSVTAVNGFATPEAVRTTRESVPAGRDFSLDLPATFGGGRDTHGGAVTALSREVT